MPRLAKAEVCEFPAGGHNTNSTIFAPRENHLLNLAGLRHPPWEVSEQDAHLVRYFLVGGEDEAVEPCGEVEDALGAELFRAKVS